VAIVAIDHGDLGGVTVHPVQPVRSEGAGGTAAEDHDPGGHVPIVVAPTRRDIGERVRREATNYARGVWRGGSHTG
jgi:hypothetical protein